jgi:hypothetical protein
VKTLIPAAAGYFQLWLDADNQLCRTPIIAWRIDDAMSLTIEALTWMPLDEEEKDFATIECPGGRCVDGYGRTYADADIWLYKTKDTA